MAGDCLEAVHEREPGGREVGAIAGESVQVAGRVQDVVVGLDVVLGGVGPFVSTVVEWFAVHERQFAAEEFDGFARAASRPRAARAMNTARSVITLGSSRTLASVAVDSKGLPAGDGPRVLRRSDSLFENVFRSRASPPQTASRISGFLVTRPAFATKKSKRSNCFGTSCTASSSRHKRRSGTSNTNVPKRNDAGVFECLASSIINPE